MKFLLFFIFISLKGVSQKITLCFYDQNIPVPYVSVKEKKEGIIGYSNKIGVATLKEGVYDLTFTHVSFDDVNIKFVSFNQDTLININLIRKASLLAEVTITTRKKHKNNYSKIGYSSSKYDSGIELRGQNMFGIIIKTPADRNPQEIRSVKFKTSEIKNPYNQDFLLEIKMFSINNRQIDSIPLNEIPIYVHSDNLRKNNELFLTEKINFPPGDLLITIFFPQIFENNNDMSVTFPGNFSSEKSKFFVQKNINNLWNQNTLNIEGHRGINYKFLDLAFEITYWNN